MKNLLLIFSFLLISLISKSQVQILDEIVPIGPFHTTEAFYIKGGFAVFQTATERNTLLIEPRRRVGQLVYVVDDAKFYQLQGGTGDGNWIPVAMGDDVMLNIGDYIFDTIHLADHNTAIWELRISGDTIYFNGEAFVPGGSSLTQLSLNVDREINFIANGTNLKDVVGYSPMRLDSLLNYVLYAASPPGASISPVGATVFEIGGTNTVNMNWTATNSDPLYPITTITINGANKNPTGATQSGTHTGSISANTTYTLYVEESSGLSAQASTSYYFRSKLYVAMVANPTSPATYPWTGAPGNASSPYYQITDAQIRAYDYDEFKTGFNQADKITLSNPGMDGRIVVIAPTSFGEPQASDYNNTMFTNLTKQKEWNFTNAAGGVVSYSMWVGNQILSASTVEIKLKQR